MKPFQLAPVPDDGLPTPEVGPWSADKHHFLRRYIHAFTTAMHKKKWASLHYIDLFAGAGVERIRESGLDWGSPLIAAQSPNQFERLHLSELDPDLCRALESRVSRFPQRTPPQVVCGDANEVVGHLIEALPEKSLSLAFLDPHGLHLKFETLRCLANRRVDFVIYFPDHIDALRNCEFVYEDNPNSNLDLVLDFAPWRDTLRSCARDNWATELRKLYVQKIETLGYRHFEYERIQRTDGRFLYQLIFCSKDEAGVKIWKGIAQTKPDGQRSLNFD